MIANLSNSQKFTNSHVLFLEVLFLSTVQFL
nr:MAG TPA: hypothetical protein [Caudoviricetes sp.]